jgi:hypothetical protein
MTSTDRIELPFPAPYLYVINGQVSYKAQNNAQYFGGWATDAVKLDEITQSNPVNVPAGYQRVTMAGKEGNEYDAYITRSVLVAPIAKREAWYLDKQRQPHYVPGARHAVQILAYLAERIKGSNTNLVTHPWGPVVLTPKGYQASFVLNAIYKDWEKGTAEIRNRIAPGVSPYLFYIAIGTFGQERKQVMVGKQSQSPVTPMSCYLGDKLSDAMVEGLFVGEEVAEVMVDLKNKAAEWLKAWNNTDEVTTENGETQPPDNYSEDIPF